jgi:hypothetical protein
MSEKLRDEHGIPKAYTMIEGLEKVEDDMNASTDEGESGAVPYFNITANIRDELTMYLTTDEAMQVQDLLLEKKFEKVYDLLDEHWEKSVREAVPDGHLDGWSPDNSDMGKA